MTIFNPSWLREAAEWGGALALGLFILMHAGLAGAAMVRDAYYAHPAKEDAHGVIAPWHTGQNGPLDERVRIAVDVYKRYPWVDTTKAVLAAPDFIYNSHWSISEAGEIAIPPTNDWMCGDLSQRAWSIIKGLTAYYQYSGDPIAFVYIDLVAQYVLDYALTPEDHAWPRFPISTPTNGKAYGICDPNTRIQLDLCARLGEDILTAYKLTGNERYFTAAKHWGDLFAQHCNFDPQFPPWNRYVDPSVVGWSDKLTGSTTMILEFLDALIDAGYTGPDGAILRARDAGVAYVRNTLLPAWAKNETWGRQYWDWDNPVTCGIVSMCGDYILAERAFFPNWRNDLRNMLSLIFNRNGVDPGSMGDVYSGAWAFPESCTCCGTSLSYNQYTSAPTFIRFGVIADDEWAREIGRRMMLMATYDTDPNGVVKDGILGAPVATGEWSNLAHPWPLCQAMEALAWMPDTFGPLRENHIMRSTSVVDWVCYGDGRIEYTTFDAPPETIDVLRLAYLPTSISAGDGPLEERPALDRNGYAVEALGNGDYLISIRHDACRRIAIEGDDPQQVIARDALNLEGAWTPLDASDGAAFASAETGARLRVAFHGNQVRLVGRVDEQGGLADVYLDGQKQMTLVDCWNPKPRDRQIIYRRSGLANGPHELEIVVKGDGNLASRGTRICVDSVQFSAAEGASDWGAGGGPTDVQRMIFGYMGRKDYVDSKGHAWRPATEFVVRSGYGTDSVEQALWTDRRTMYIGNTDDPELFRYGIHGDAFWTNVTVGPGRYYVRLLFADTPLHWFLEKDKDGGFVRHIQSVLINREEVLTAMDVAKAAGGTFRAHEELFLDVEPMNGVIEVWLKGCEEREAILQALEVGPMDALTESEPAGGAAAEPVSLVHTPARDSKPKEPIVPVIDGDWWPIAGNPDLGKYTTDEQEPVDFGVWQAADGTWQLWSCIRTCGCGGHTRLFHAWEGRTLEESPWTPKGIAMESRPDLGEEPGGLQAPHVIRHEGLYWMAYGDWTNICFATSEDGKHFERIIQANGKTGVFSEGPVANTRDPMLIRINGLWHCYYTAICDGRGYGLCRTSSDLRHWSASFVVSYGGSIGPGPWWNECPHVVEVKPGEFVYFRNQFYGEGQLSWQYYSTNPRNFGVDTDAFLTGSLPIAAPEIIFHEGQYYLVALNPGLDGVRMSRLRWGRLGRVGRPVFDFDDPAVREQWRLAEGDLDGVFFADTHAPFEAESRHVIGTAERKQGGYDDART
ncbi:MAG: hypothetical protein JXR94_00975, partial [Candidatus Hydrogenedentes bacterium]|nr:hypothetical protein [Candidatus Hydrogenedentota bacterium]